MGGRGSSSRTSAGGLGLSSTEMAMVSNTMSNVDAMLNEGFDEGDNIARMLLNLDERKTALVMSLDEYMGIKGVGSPLSGYMDDKLKIPHGETRRQTEKREKEAANVRAEYEKKRAAAKAEYKAMVDSGKVRPPSRIEEMVRTAQGSSDNSSVQAARRLLAKRGIDWRTGKAL